MEKLGSPVPSKATLQSFIGPPLLDSFRNLGLSEGLAKQAVAYYRDYYAQKGVLQAKEYKGIAETLAALAKDAQMYIATSKPEIFAKEILKNLDLSQYFSGIYGADLEGKRNTKGDVLAYALAESQVTAKSRSVMIGDRSHDMIGAKQNGLGAIGVLYGFGSAQELVDTGAIDLAQSPNDLLRLIH